MKKPKPGDLVHDKNETRKVRSKMQRPQSVMITINIDAESLEQLKNIAKESGIPYQRLLNKVLKEGLDKESSTESRLEKLEKELNRLKKQLAA